MSTPSRDNVRRIPRRTESRRAPRRAPATPANLALLTVIAAELAPDEVDVLILIAQRLKQGASVYGELRLDADLRSFDLEAQEELIDFLAYRSMLALQRLRTEVRSRKDDA